MNPKKTQMNLCSPSAKSADVEFPFLMYGTCLVQTFFNKVILASNWQCFELSTDDSLETVLIALNSRTKISLTKGLDRGTEALKTFRRVPTKEQKHH